MAVYDQRCVWVTNAQMWTMSNKRDGANSILKIVLKTGRPHQIRSQLAHLGCPIKGDLKYGAPDDCTKNILLYQHLVIL